MLNIGPRTLDMLPYTRCRLMADGPITLYGIQANERVCIYGSPKPTDGLFQFTTVADTNATEFVCADATHWQIEESGITDGKEHPDPTPIEIGLTPQLSLREEMQRYIREEIGRQAVTAGGASFEEEDDFDIEGEDEFATDYTVIEMTDEPIYSTDPGDESVEPQPEPEPPSQPDPVPAEEPTPEIAQK